MINAYVVVGEQYYTRIAGQREAVVVRRATEDGKGRRVYEVTPRRRPSEVHIRAAAALHKTRQAPPSQPKLPPDAWERIAQVAAKVRAAGGNPDEVVAAVEVTTAAEHCAAYAAGERKRSAE